MIKDEGKYVGVFTKYDSVPSTIMEAVIPELMVHGLDESVGIFECEILETKEYKRFKTRKGLCGVKFVEYKCE